MKQKKKKARWLISLHLQKIELREKATLDILQHFRNVIHSPKRLM